MVRQNNGKRGKVSVPAKRVPYGKTVRVTDEGSRAEGSRLAAEDGVSDDARRNEPGRAKVLWVKVAQKRRRWPAHRGRKPSVLTCWAKAMANQRERC